MSCFAHITMQASRTGQTYSNGHHSTCIVIGWVAKQWKTSVELHATLIWTKVSASQHKFLQGLAKQGRK